MMRAPGRLRMCCTLRTVTARQLEGEQLRVAPARFRAPKTRHRGVERDPVDPGRKRRIAAERVDVPIHLQQDVLDHLVGVFLALEMPHRQLADPGGVPRGQIGNGRVVAGAKPFDQVPVSERINEESGHVSYNPGSDSFIPDLSGPI